MHSKGQSVHSDMYLCGVTVDQITAHSCVIFNIPTFVRAVKVSVISLHYACSYNSTVMQSEAVSHIASRFYRPLLFEWN